MEIIMNKTAQLNIRIYQMNALVGDLEGNCTKLLTQIKQAQAAGADLFIAPELALCGYPPEDLLLRDDFYCQVEQQLQRLQEITGIALLIGCPYREGSVNYNSVVLLQDGQMVERYNKMLLPNYGVFDECRYFTPGTHSLVVEIKGVKCGIVICEDIWGPLPVAKAALQGAELILSINASPFSVDKFASRLQVARTRVQETGLALVYVNLVGGQDEIVFDGASFALNSAGELQFLAPAFVEGSYTLSFINGTFPSTALIPYPAKLEAIYQALVLALRDYINKSGCNKVVLGLSGGIDSALTLALAVDALGAAKIHALMMQSPYTADISIADSREMVQQLSVSYDEVAIKPLMDAFNNSLAPVFMADVEDAAGNMAKQITAENLQARIRGTLLMALANQYAAFVLTTGNKSELSTGYCTLYGDMVGAFAVLKDVSKTLVYELANWRNKVSQVIPERIITRPPSAELRPDQCDQDSLPEYAILDAILEALVEQGASVAEIIALGYPENVVKKVAGLLQHNEYKRRQAAVGPKITSTAFARDWRYPIINKFKL